MYTYYMYVTFSHNGISIIKKLGTKFSYCFTLSKILIESGVEIFRVAQNLGFLEKLSSLGGLNLFYLNRTTNPLTFTRKPNFEPPYESLERI